MEAMSSGVPVIGYNTGGIPEMIINDVNGYIINNNNAQDYYNTIKKLQKKNNLSAIKECAREHALRNFDENQNFKKSKAHSFFLFFQMR